MTQIPIRSLARTGLAQAPASPLSQQKPTTPNSHAKPYPKLHAFRFDFRPIQRQPTDDADDHHSTPPRVNTVSPDVFFRRFFKMTHESVWYSRPRSYVARFPRK